MTTVQATVAASGRPGNKMVRLVQLCNLTEQQFPEDKLWESDMWPELLTLSPKIVVAARAICKGEIGRRMTRLMEDKLEEGMLIPGFEVRCYV